MNCLRGVVSSVTGRKGIYEVAAFHSRIERKDNPTQLPDPPDSNEIKSTELRELTNDTVGAYLPIVETNLDRINDRHEPPSAVKEMSSDNEDNEEIVEKIEMGAVIEKKDSMKKEIDEKNDNVDTVTDATVDTSAEDTLSSQSCNGTSENDQAVLLDQTEVKVVVTEDYEEEEVDLSETSDITSQDAESSDKERPSSLNSETQPIDSTYSTESQVKLRPKKGSGRSRSHKDRHVSCIDLGPGQYEGWLEKKADTRFGKWSPVWCVLKDYAFYYYKSKKDLKAKGIICLVGYEVSREEKKKDDKKQYQFRISHKGLKPFIFSAERKTDLDAWVEKLHLVSVMFNAIEITPEGGTENLVQIAKDMEGYHSESDDDDNSSISITVSESPSVEEEADVKGQRSSSSSTDTKDPFFKLITDVRDSGAEVKVFDRSTRLSGRRSKKWLERHQTVLHRDPARNKLLLEKRTLERTKRAKQVELDLVMALLSGPVTSKTLKEWNDTYGNILGKDENESSSDGEQDDQQNEEKEPDNKTSCNCEDKDKNDSLEAGTETCKNCLDKEQLNFSNENVSDKREELERLAGEELEQQTQDNEQTGQKEISSESITKSETNDVAIRNNCDECLDDSSSKSDNDRQTAATESHELAENIQGNGVIVVQGNETHL